MTARPSAALARSLVERARYVQDVRSRIHEMAKRAGYEEESLTEQTVVWGDMDSYKHVNNVRYIRFFESGRINHFDSLESTLGDHFGNFIQGKGIGPILKATSAVYKKPVVYPDSLLIGHRVASISEQGNEYKLDIAAYSFAQQCLTTLGDATIVLYNYDKGKKADLSKEDPAVWGEQGLLGELRRRHKRGMEARQSG